MTTCARFRKALLLAGMGAGLLIGAPGARADGNLNNVNHIIIVMQENHSYDNYFGVLGYVPSSPYHNAKGHRGCDRDRHHVRRRPDLQDAAEHGRAHLPQQEPEQLLGLRAVVPRAAAVHRSRPRPQLGRQPPGRQLQAGQRHAALEPEQRVRPGERRDRGAGADVRPRHHGVLRRRRSPLLLRHRRDVRDQRSLLLRGDRPDVPEPRLPAWPVPRSVTSRPARSSRTGGYKPINGTIYDRLDAAGVVVDRLLHRPAVLAHLPDVVADTTKPFSSFAADAAAGTLPPVAFVDGSILRTSRINGSSYETDEHPPADIRAGQYSDRPRSSRRCATARAGTTPSSS